MSYNLIPAFALAMLVATPVASYAQNSTIGAQAEDIGMREYVNHCAVCHGDFGKGDGPLVPWLRQTIPDLTTIQRKIRAYSRSNEFTGLLMAGKKLAVTVAVTCRYGGDHSAGRKTTASLVT